jgi:hypothetical protein
MVSSHALVAMPRLCTLLALLAPMSLPLPLQAADQEPEPPQVHQLLCRFDDGGWRRSKVLDYGFAIELEQPDASVSTYHFAVDTAPPRGGRAVDNFGENWSIAKQPSPYSLMFTQPGSSRRIACKA